MHDPVTRIFHYVRTKLITLRLAYYRVSLNLRHDDVKDENWAEMTCMPCRLGAWMP
jgi:hypothetical protein